MVSTKQKSIKIILKISSTVSKHIIRENHLTMQEDRKRREKEEKIFKGSSKPLPIDNNLEWKWIKLSN